MSSAFDQMFAESGVPALMETMGTTGIVYLEPEENPVELTAIVGHMEVVEVEDGSSHGRRKIARRGVIIATDPDGDYAGVAEPRLSAQVEIDGQWWDVEAIEPQTGSLARLTVVRKVVTEMSRAGYRGR